MAVVHVNGTLVPIGEPGAAYFSKPSTLVSSGTLLPYLLEGSTGPEQIVTQVAAGVQMRSVNVFVLAHPIKIMCRRQAEATRWSWVTRDLAPAWLVHCKAPLSSTRVPRLLVCLATNSSVPTPRTTLVVREISPTCLTPIDS